MKRRSQRPKEMNGDRDRKEGGNRQNLGSTPPTADPVQGENAASSLHTTGPTSPLCQWVFRGQIPGIKLCLKGFLCWEALLSSILQHQLFTPGRGHSLPAATWVLKTFCTAASLCTGGETMGDVAIRMAARPRTTCAFLMHPFINTTRE